MSPEPGLPGSGFSLSAAEQNGAGPIHPYVRLIASGAWQKLPAR
jgi:hypothetical protein